MNVTQFALYDSTSMAILLKEAFIKPMSLLMGLFMINCF